MIDKISKFIDVVYAILSIWLYRIAIAKEKREDVKKLSEEATTAIKERRYDDVVIIWNRMRLL